MGRAILIVLSLASDVMELEHNDPLSYSVS